MQLFSRKLVVGCIFLFAAGIAWGAAPPADDGQIVAWLQAVDSGETEAGKYAQVHARDAGVKNFARQMSVDHREDGKKTSDLPRKSGIIPAESEAATALRAETKQNLERLKSLKGREFDKAYLEMQVNGHRKVLQTVDEIVPNAKNEALLSHLKNLRPKLEAHLRQAETLSSKFNK